MLAFQGLTYFLIFNQFLYLPLLLLALEGNCLQSVSIGGLNFSCSEIYHLRLLLNFMAQIFKVHCCVFGGFLEGLDVGLMTGCMDIPFQSFNSFYQVYYIHRLIRICLHRVHPDILQLCVKPLNFTHVWRELQVQLVNQVSHLFKESLRISLKLLKLSILRVGSTLATLRESDTITKLLHFVKETLILGIAFLLIQSQMFYLCLHVTNLPFKLLRRLPLAIEFFTHCIG